MMPEDRFARVTDDPAPEVPGPPDEAREPHVQLSSLTASALLALLWAISAVPCLHAIDGDGMIDFLSTTAIPSLVITVLLLMLLTRSQPWHLPVLQALVATLAYGVANAVSWFATAFPGLGV